MAGTVAASTSIRGPANSVDLRSYAYKARSTDGVLVEGLASAPSLDALHEQLSERGLFLEKARLKKGKNTFSFGGSLFKRRSNRNRWLFTFNRDLKSLIQAGMTIDQALVTMIKLTPAPEFQAILQTVHSRVRQGSALAKALHLESANRASKAPEDHIQPNAHSPKNWPFTGSYIAAIGASERSGELAEVLGDLDTLLASDQEVNAKWRKAMVYPIMLAIMMVGILVLMFTFVVPRFASIYEDLNAPLPLITKWILMLHQNMQTVGLVLVVLFLIYFLFKNMARRRSGGSEPVFFSKIKQSLPVFGTLIRQRLELESLFVLSCLSSAGLPIQEALDQLAGSSSHPLHRAKLWQTSHLVRDGVDLNQAMSETGLFDERRMAIIGTGLASGDLSPRLKFAATDLQQEFSAKIDKLTVLAEPLMLLLVGVVVGTILVAIYLPIFGLSALVG